MFKILARVNNIVLSKRYMTLKSFTIDAALGKVQTALLAIQSKALLGAAALSCLKGTSLRTETLYLLVLTLILTCSLFNFHS